MRASNSVVSCHKVLYVQHKSLWTNVMHGNHDFGRKISLQSRCTKVAKTTPPGGVKKGPFLGYPPGGVKKGTLFFRLSRDSGPPRQNIYYLVCRHPPGGVFLPPPQTGDRPDSAHWVVPDLGCDNHVADPSPPHGCAMWQHIGEMYKW